MWVKKIIMWLKINKIRGGQKVANLVDKEAQVCWINRTIISMMKKNLFVISKALKMQMHMRLNEPQKVYWMVHSTGRPQRKEKRKTRHSLIKQREKQFSQIHQTFHHLANCLAKTQQNSFSWWRDGISFMGQLSHPMKTRLTAKKKPS